MGPPTDGPWKPVADSGRGYLSVFFSERMARWPVREITRPGDNKSDPNLETATYGLFSTCEPAMRNRVVHDGACTILFLTTHQPGKGRLLVGYYHVGWYTEGTQGAINRDYALAANAIRFIDPIPVSQLPDKLAAECAVQFRQMRPLDVELTEAFRKQVDTAVDRTARYIGEIKRIEQFSRAQSGLAYPSWGRQEGFSWQDAGDYYQTDENLSKVPNGSKSKKWRCRSCSYVIRSGALLKKCPLCKQRATLVPEN
jgi:hypothetical protein